MAQCGVVGDGGIGGEELTHSIEEATLFFGAVNRKKGERDVKGDLACALRADQGSQWAGRDPSEIVVVSPVAFCGDEVEALDGRYGL